MAALYRVFAARTPERGESVAALAVGVAWFIVGVAVYDPHLVPDHPEKSSAVITLFTVLWLGVMLVGGWTLGARWGVAYAIALTLSVVPMSLLAIGQPPPHMTSSAWVFSLFISLTFGGLAGAMADHYRQAKLRTFQLAQKNEELARTSEALARSDAMFREFADRVELGMWIRPLEPGASVYMNAAARRMVGVSDPNDISWRERVHPDDLAASTPPPTPCAKVSRRTSSIA